MTHVALPQYSGICLRQPHEQAGKVTEGTRCLQKKSANPILPVRICIVRALSAFFSCVCIFSRFLLSGTDCAMEARA